MRILSCLLIVVAVGVGCNQKSGDGSSKEAMRKAINQYKDSLKNAQKRGKATLYARELAQRAGKYTDLHPKDTMTPKYHYLLGDLHFSYLQNHQKALNHLKKLRTTHPDHKKAPFALFTAGFFYEQMNKTEKAKKQYELFLKEYPDHKLAEDVRLSKNRLGKSAKEQLEEALQKRRERKQDSLEN